MSSTSVRTMLASVYLVESYSVETKHDPTTCRYTDAHTDLTIVLDINTRQLYRNVTQ